MGYLSFKKLLKNKSCLGFYTTSRKHSHFIVGAVLYPVPVIPVMSCYNSSEVACIVMSYPSLYPYLCSCPSFLGSTK